MVLKCRRIDVNMMPSRPLRLYDAILSHMPAGIIFIYINYYFSTYYYLHNYVLIKKLEKSVKTLFSFT